MDSRPTRHAPALLQAVLAVMLTLGVAVQSAAAITVGTTATSLSDNTTGASSTYTFTGYTTEKNRPLSYAEVTFPAGTVVTGAVAVLPNTTVTVTGETTVRVTYPRVAGVPSVPGSTTFSVAVGGIVNPAAGTYPANSVTIVCWTTNKGGGNLTADPAVPTAGYTIDPAPYITLTVTTPGPGQTVDFGTIDPGTISTPQGVTVDVTSSHPYSLTRTIAGDDALMGLTVTGSAEGASLSAGTASYADSYTIAPPWTTDPDVPLAATVTYTVVQTIP